MTKSPSREMSTEESVESPKGALAMLKTKASEIQAKAPADKPISNEQAMVMASQQNPELKKKYREQFRSKDTVG